MSQAEKWLQVHIVVLVILSTLLLGNGLNSLTVPVVAGSAAVLAFIFTERLRWIRLNRFVANVAAIGVAAFAIYRFFQNESSADVKLTAIANLLTYVQVILLFQEKSPRLYWNIWVLSLLQVVVAGALSLHFQVGVLFFVFFLVSLSAMTVMAVYVDAEAAAQRAGKSHPEPAKSLTNQTRKRTLLSVFENLAEHESVRVMMNPPQPVGLGRLMRMSWVAGMITIIFATLLFFSIPRQQNAWYGPNYSKRAKVGFSTNVSFDYAEDITPSNQTVMRVRFLDQDNKAKELIIEPYFRGITVPVFQNNARGTIWLPSPHQFRPTRRLANPPDIQPFSLSEPLDAEEGGLRSEERGQDLKDGYSLVRQQVVLQPSEDFILFSMMPAFKNAVTSKQVRFDNSRESLSRAAQTDEYLDGPFHFDVTVPLYFDRPFPAIPAQQQIWDGMYETIRPSPREFPALYEAAAGVVKRADAKGNRALLAYRMGEYLGNNEKFTYTLNYSRVKFDRTLNPIEDFVRNHKTGHCEYYAAALALMLRTVDIPSRLVIGYKGGDYNEMGNYYEVKEKHAHVWVEAYLPAADCSPRMMATGQASPRFGAWYRLDPTPEANTETGESNSKGLVDQAGDAISYAQFVWDDYVVGMNSERQQSNLFNPDEGGLLGRIFEDKDWQNQLSRIPSAFRGGFWMLAARILLIATFFLVLRRLYRLAVAKKFGQRVPQPKTLHIHRVAKVVDAVSPWLAKLMFGETTSRPDIRVDFYERFLKILRKQGITPAGHQTALEFASAVMCRLGTAPTKEAEVSDQDCRSDILTNPSVGLAPRGSTDPTHSLRTTEIHNGLDPRLQAILGVITSEFYRVRFGRDSLDNSRAEKVESALKELESVLALHSTRLPKVNAVG